jgi:serine/threonine protein kinase
LIGKTLAHYEITELLGEGGMGEVYRAQDRKLNREVALKVLPDQFASDRQRMGRFEREARLLASLNHPHIASVYGLEEEGGKHALVMELVEGETLRDRISRGPIPLEESARIALELARAIEYAHDKGVVHRDLKPANVMLGVEGHVKVLDFGLAKALDTDMISGDIAESPTLTAAATQAGIILGTAAYMSPEQAAGGHADRRADIWSYGVIVAEMLSGRQQFHGETVSHTLASVLKDEPDWDALPDQVPLRIVRLLQRCLQKKPKQRLQAIGEARVLFEEYLAEPHSFEVDLSSSSAPRRRSTTLVPWGIATVAVVALAVALFRGGETTDGPRPVPYSLTIPVPGTTNYVDNAATPPAISPDGRLVAYGMTDQGGIDQIWIRPLDSFDSYPLNGTIGALYPFWSPDSRHLGFFQDGRLRRIEIDTGRSQTITDKRAFYPRGASWTTSDKILFSHNSNTGIWVVDANGGEARQVTFPDSSVVDSSHRWPYALPDGNHFLFLGWTNDASAIAQFGGIYLASLDGSAAPRRILRDTSSAVYSTTGHILVMQERNLVAIPFDADALRVDGEGFVVAEGILVNRNNAQAAFTVSHTETLVFARGLGSIPRASLQWADRQGEVKETPIDPVPMFGDLRLSPDATRAVTTLPGPTGDPEVWILDLVRGVRSRLTPSAPWTTSSPVWSPDGTRVLYVSAQQGSWDLYTRNSDGSGTEEPVLVNDFDKVASDWQDSRVLLWSDDANRAGAVIQILDLDSGNVTEVFEDPGSPAPRFSPDGRYISYFVNEGGRDEVFIRDIESGARWQVSTSGGRLPHWSDDGSEIVYLDPQRRVMAVDVELGDDGVVLGRPRQLFQVLQNVIAWDVTGDHTRFLLAARPELASEPLHVMLNWDAIRP